MDKMTDAKAKSPTNKYDVELARISANAFKTGKLADNIAKILLIGILCYTIVKIISYPAENIRAIAEVVGVSSKLLAGSIVVNILLLIAFLITFLDNQKLRKERE